VPNFGANLNTFFEWYISGYDGLIAEWVFFVNGTTAYNVLVAATVDIFAGGFSL
tara:strand:- start:3550 stop:3711 length:162 start_codon:yes stop_codon:yes gene_type:complete